MVPLVGNICTIGTNLITNGSIGKEIGANGKNGNTIGTNGTNVTNQWYHWENPEHTHSYTESKCLLTIVSVVTGRFGRESFRPWVVSAWVVSALGRFGQFWWVVSVWVFFFFQLCLMYVTTSSGISKLIYHVFNQAMVQGCITGWKMCFYSNSKTCFSQF